MPQYLARREPIVVAGEVAEIRLTVFRDQDVVHVNEGDQFVTVQTRVSLFDDPTSL